MFDPIRGLPARAFATVWLTLFLDLVAFGIILPVTPFYAESFGASPSTVALLSAAFSLAQFTFAPMLGKLSDRVGRRPVMLVSIAGSVVAHLTLSLSTSLTMVFLARVFAGMSNANVATAHAYVADRVPAEHRARAMGWLGSAIGLGFVCGPALGGLLSTAAMPELPFTVAAGLAAINFVMAWRWLPQSRPCERGPSRPARRAVFGRALRDALWRTPLGWLVLVNCGFFFVFAGMTSTFALFCEATFGWGSRETGFLYVLIGLAIVGTQGFVLGRTVAALGEKRTMVVGMAVLAFGLASCATADSVGALAAGAVCIAVGNGLSTPCVSALVSRTARPDQQGWAQGLSQSSAALARIAAPVAAGGLFEALGAGVPMLVGAVLLVTVCMPVVALAIQPQPRPA